MKTYTQAELAGALALHAKWLRGEDGGVRANLTHANLTGADLAGADLTGANLKGANLKDAYLAGADLPDGSALADYIKNEVPALCTAGGKSLEEVAKAWDCHDWTNCPMATAFGVHGLSEISEPFRKRAAIFVALFDGKHLPKPDTETENGAAK